jgi:hypothetical protein
MLLANLFEEERLLLQRLPFAARAVFNHYDRSTESLCLPNTRVDILHKIMAWARSQLGPSGSSSGSDGQQRIYRPDGMAGTGKSTIAHTIARRCFDEERLGASLFSRGGGELESARKFVTSIAVQLVQRSPALRRHVCEAVCAHANIASQLLSDQ